MGTCWNRLITSYSGHFLACQGVDCTFRWKGLIGNDNLLTEGIYQPTSPGCLSASSATISTGRLADRSCCQRPQAQVCSSISPALVFALARVRGTITGCAQVAKPAHTTNKMHTYTHKQFLINTAEESIIGELSALLFIAQVKQRPRWQQPAWRQFTLIIWCDNDQLGSNCIMQMI